MYMTVCEWDRCLISDNTYIRVGRHDRLFIDIEKREKSGEIKMRKESGYLLI